MSIIYHDYYINNIYIVMIATIWMNYKDLIAA